VGTHSLSEDYNAGQYERDAVSLLCELMHSHSGNTPFAILTGGSMLYMNAVLKGLDNLPSVPPAIRQAVQNEYRTNGLQWLQEEVQRIDPEYWNEVDRQNPQRLMHCIEVTRTADIPYSALRTQTAIHRPWHVHITSLVRPREELYNRINRRLEQMIANGLEEETRQAYLPFKQQGLPIPNSLRTVGYNEMIDYIEGRCTKQEAIDKIKQHTRNYAKRQMTWYRNSTSNWYSAD
jgi:tRNA dimethylallyltransferase